MARDENTVLHVFNEYVQAFQTLRAPAVTSYFHFPCMLIAPQGVAVMANATEVESLLDKMMEGLKARGYARSELTDVEAILLSENIVLVSVSRARYKIETSRDQRHRGTTNRAAGRRPRPSARRRPPRRRQPVAAQRHEHPHLLRATVGDGLLRTPRRVRAGRGGARAVATRRPGRGGARAAPGTWRRSGGDSPPESTHSSTPPGRDSTASHRAPPPPSGRRRGHRRHPPRALAGLWRAKSSALSSSSATSSNGAWTQRATPACPSPITACPSSSSATRDTPPVWPPRPSRTSASTAPPISSAGSAPGALVRPHGSTVTEPA